jgi:hypothetical protein
MEATMKKLILSLLFTGALFSPAQAEEGCNQHLTPDEFRAKQKEVITETARLTPQEAAAFFPVYFELQDRKRKLNDKMWKEIRRSKNDNITEAQYGEMIETISNTRIALAQLDEEYIGKFRKILSNKKIFLVQRAELRFR